MKKMLKAVIFDLDGTILDTLGDLTASTNYALAKNNLPQRSLEEVRSFVGNGIRLLIERSVPSNIEKSFVDSCFEDFKEHYKNNSAVLTKPYSGIPTLVKALRNMGIKTAVVSNKADFAVQVLVEKYFPSLFDYYVGEKEGVRRKPYPDSVFCALDYLCVSAEQCVYVGDSDVDIETARNSNIKCIAVTWGFRDRAFLEAHNPDYVADTPNEILEIIGENYEGFVS